MRIRTGRLARAGLLLFLFASAIGCFLLLGLRWEVHFPVSGSLPFGLYKTVDGEVRGGGLVRLCLPEDIARIGLETGILSKRWWDPCVLGSRPMLKIAAAVGGDRVRLEATRLLVNGSLFASWPERVPTPGGRAPKLPVELVIPEGWVWLHAQHPRSWDSRHFGPIPLEDGAVPVAPYLLLTTRYQRFGSSL